MIALAQTPTFAWMPGRLLDMPSLSVLLAIWQPKLETALTLGALDDRLAYLALAVFSAALATSLFGPRIETLGARLMTPFMLRGSRR
jgi:hypothetical protein